jgi:hypothetical protein
MLVAACPVATAAGFFAGAPALLLVLQAATGYVPLIVLVREGRRRKALAAMIVWAFLLGASTTLLAIGWPERGSRVILRGEAYWSEMELWLETGQGAEGDPWRFVPQHVVHAAVFTALSLATASAAGILFGTALMNYMAYYVARVVLLSPSHPFLAGLLAWHPWSLIRIGSFVGLGVVLCEPLLARWGRGGVAVSPRGWWIAVAAGGLVADMVLKALLAPSWRALLLSLRG